jgi:hypothetical protein
MNPLLNRHAHIHEDGDVEGINEREEDGEHIRELHINVKSLISLVWTIQEASIRNERT